jgi:hypothetical protein
LVCSGICPLSAVLLLLKLTGALDSTCFLLDDALVLHACYFIYFCLVAEAAGIYHFHHQASLSATVTIVHLAYRNDDGPQLAIHQRCSTMACAGMRSIIVSCRASIRQTTLGVATSSSRFRGSGVVGSDQQIVCGDDI